MAFFDSIKDKALDLAQSGMAKSRQLGEIAKLTTANMSEEDAIKKAYIEIGKLYYAERGMAPEAAYTALCEKITASKAAIEENKSRIEELKKEGSISDADVPAAAPAVEPLSEESPAAPAVDEPVGKAPEE